MLPYVQNTCSVGISVCVCDRVCTMHSLVRDTPTVKGNENCQCCPNLTPSSWGAGAALPKSALPLCWGEGCLSAPLPQEAKPKPAPRLPGPGGAAPARLPGPAEPAAESPPLLGVELLLLPPLPGESHGAACRPRRGTESAGRAGQPASRSLPGAPAPPLSRGGQRAAADPAGQARAGLAPHGARRWRLQGMCQSRAAAGPGRGHSHQAAAAAVIGY